MLSIEKIKQLAEEYGTPLYIFDKDELQERVRCMQQILKDDVVICYAMKANPFLVDAMRKLSAKYEVCSPGEFSICEREKVDMKSIVLSGVNKEKEDICHVMDDCGGVGMYTIESLQQLALLQECAAERNIKIPVLLRLTSGNQFGMDEKTIESIVSGETERDNLVIEGIQYYSGTQKKGIQVMAAELERIDAFCDYLKEKYDFIFKELEYGPALPINYFGESAADNNYDMLRQFSAVLDSYRGKYKITLEMGRFIAATCGIYVSSVADVKTNEGQNYCIIDGGINHINYYGQTMAMKVPAYTFVKKNGEAVSGYLPQKNGFTEINSAQEKSRWTICGSLCTVADVIVKNLPIGEPKLQDMLIFYNIGAYSVTEGIYMFLSRRMPKIVSYSENEGSVLYRDTIYSDKLNSRQILLD